MADYLIIGCTVAIFAVATLALWRLAGPARTTTSRILRAALAVLLGTLLALGLTYTVSRSRSFQLAGRLVQRVETQDKIVALTFDDGPTPEYTDEILGILASKDVRASFYFTGAESEQNPQALRAVIEAGHELGNHTFTHRRMLFAPGSSIAEELERTDAVFRAAGYEGPTTFRPPGCKRLLTAPLYLAGHERTTVTWDLEPDSIASIAEDPDELTRYVADNVTPGSIVLMHVMYDAREPSREALPEIIDTLAADGYRFVTVSEMIAESEHTGAASSR